MKNKEIFLKDIEDVETIVGLAEKRNYRVKVKNGDVEIDATSFMGLISQATGKAVVIQYEDSDTDLEERLERFSTKKIEINC